MTLFRCPYLNGDVELTDEREHHIMERHPDLFPEHHDKVRVTIEDPDEVRRSQRFGQARLFSRWFGDLREGNT
jgi:hypothetical protein